MKIAFCFLTRRNLLQEKIWQAFFARASSQNYNLYCHPKEPALVTGPVLRNRMIKNLVPTQHGQVSIVKATLNLFIEAYRDDLDNEYFLLISESTIPIVSFSYLYDHFWQQSPRSLIGYSVPPPETEHYRRLFTVREFVRFARAFFHHHQWIILHRRHVSILLDHPGLTLFSNVFAPDEHYFMNVLVHLRGVSLCQFANHCPTFANWRDKEIKQYYDRATGQLIGQTIHPKTYYQLSKADIDQAVDANYWFFRKVDTTCDCSLVMRLLV
jgi:hypothetical protein